MVNALLFHNFNINNEIDYDPFYNINFEEYKILLLNLSRKIESNQYKITFDDGYQSIIPAISFARSLGFETIAYIITSKINNVCFAGGVAMNVKSNLVISKERKISRFYVPFAPDDNSLSIGACYITQKNNINKFNSSFKNKKISIPYIGLSSEMKNRDNYILKIFKNKKYKIHKTQINNIASKLLSKGSVIGRCVGKSEFGSRALGNRSILAHPSMKNIKNKINEKIKNRDFWMPFAATVLEKYASKYFYFNTPKKDYQYMTNCVHTKKLGKICLSEAIHNYDETCRPQILLKNINPDYEDLINSFGKITGIYGILNTSLNIHGYPIVGNEFEAINIFKKTNLDGLILRDYFVEKIVK